MKKLLLFISLILIFVGAMAQSTAPRWGTLKNQDNTGRVITYKLLPIVDAVGTDSVIVKPNASQTLITVTLVDSLCLKQPVIAQCALGDKMTIIASAASGTPVIKFSGTNWKVSGTGGRAKLSTNLRAVIELVFDGSKWVESYRTVQ